MASKRRLNDFIDDEGLMTVGMATIQHMNTLAAAGRELLDSIDARDSDSQGGDPPGEDIYDAPSRE